MHYFSMALAVALLAVPAATVAQDDDDVTQGDLQVAHGQVNWTDRVITATGSGAPDLKAQNLAVARLGAERVAKLDALRNIMETIKGLQLSSEITVEQALVTNEKMKTKVEGIIRNFKVVKTNYYSDGGVDIIVQVPLDGVLGSTLVPGATEGKALPEGQPAYTGVIIDARGLKPLPALSPRLLDENGKTVYAAELLDQKVIEKWGVLAYFKDLEAARKNNRAGANPLLIKALKLANGKSDLVLSNADVLKFSDPAANQKLLAEGRVIVVTD